jgi:hypothetical protein
MSLSGHIRWRARRLTAASRRGTRRQILDPCDGYRRGRRVNLSQGNPWTADYLKITGELDVDLRSNIAAEARANIVYERLINFCSDAGTKDALQFLMTREATYMKASQPRWRACRSRLHDRKDRAYKRVVRAVGYQRTQKLNFFASSATGAFASFLNALLRDHRRAAQRLRDSPGAVEMAPRVHPRTILS